MTEKQQSAKALHDKGFNCAQAVALPFCEELGMPQQLAMKAMEGFGAGMGLPNMKKYSDEMTIDSVVGEGTTLKMIVYAQSTKS